MRKKAVLLYTLAAVSAFNYTQVSAAAEISPNAPTVIPVMPATAVPVTDDLAVTATKVQILGANQELQQIITNLIKTRAGGDTSQTQLQKDVEAILSTGLFANATVISQPNSAGLDVVYQVQPVLLKSLDLNNAKVLTLPVVNEIFKDQIGLPVSPAALKIAGDKINEWYKQNNYDLAQVVFLQPSRDGKLIVEVAEGVVGDINIKFIDRDGKLTAENGEPVQGRTRQDFIKGELKMASGDIFSRDKAQEDLMRLYKTGLFENATISLDGDARKVNITYNLTEAPARAINGGLGYNASTGVVGTISYQDNNLGGANQKLGLNVQGNTRDLQFDAKFGDPYRESNPNRWGYSVNAFRNRVVSLTFDDEVKLANGDRAREGQFGGGVTLSRPVGDWQASVGVNYQRTSIRDADGELTPTDSLGNSLSLSGTGIDDLTTVSASLTRDRRDNPINPTSGSLVSVGTKQSVPVGQGNILMNQLEGSYTQYVPVGFVQNNGKSDVFAFNVQGGTTIGDLPPYEAYNLGGPNSVRGYRNGELGTARSYVVASAEYRVPIWQPVTGVLFADFGSDLGSQETVPGEPGVVRDKPGIGFGYGAGVRLNTPIGVIRADYGINDQGEGRLQFGVGQRF
ncbi:BamA/TamA family outer membrane protein [Ancylothrix sp. C2]|uniref:BamA/TamA family outer membrane protein n=1 Tax=Ancylothrix sp. D3o TaxID=2953691 RepID=UPI0021BA586F|nr:BamA/TamA family outer membrane protein [Ancylothrix sp. D3o]MCT7950872.1 BamA/TamA family outer membrane protein [Ancylothrix sp. D3o]